MFEQRRLSAHRIQGSERMRCSHVSCNLESVSSCMASCRYQSRPCKSSRQLARGLRPRSFFSSYSGEIIVRKEGITRILYRLHTFLVRLRSVIQHSDRFTLEIDPGSRSSVDLTDVFAKTKERDESRPVSPVLHKAPAVPRFCIYILCNLCCSSQP